METEAVGLRDVHAVARLRAYTTSSMSSMALACGLYAITGGLGGLGLRAASMLIEAGAVRVVLSSRRACVARGGQGLESRLQSIGSLADVVSCDGADPSETSALVKRCGRSLVGVRLVIVYQTVFAIGLLVFFSQSRSLYHSLCVV